VPDLRVFYPQTIASPLARKTAQFAPGGPLKKRNARWIRSRLLGTDTQESLAAGHVDGRQQVGAAVGPSRIG
jgi:hypothetical protein